MLTKETQGAFWDDVPAWSLYPNSQKAEGPDTASVGPATRASGLQINILTWIEQNLAW